MENLTSMAIFAKVVDESAAANVILSGMNQQ